MREKGNNIHGNMNEEKLVESLHEKSVKNLNLNLKEFIKDICKEKGIAYSEDIYLNAFYVKNNKVKQDFYLIINDIRVDISLKMGSGNSVHQEKCEAFLDYLKKECSSSEEICNLLRFFIWADGTLDGTGEKRLDNTGKIVSRFTSTEYKKSFPEERMKIQKFLDDNQERLIKRCLFGTSDESKVDFIYHGTTQNGVWISFDKIIEYQLEQAQKKKKKQRSCFLIGGMSLQVWNVSKSGAMEERRGQIQVKYGNMKKDFDKLMKENIENIGTFSGDGAEFDFVRKINKDKKSRTWKILGRENNDNLFCVRVTKKALSQLSGRKVFPKADAYLIQTELDEAFILSRDYIITEDDLEELDYSVISASGISIKIKNSNNYTIQKFTKESFYKAFSPFHEKIEYVFVSLLLYSTESEMWKNEKILLDLNIEQKEMHTYIRNQMNKEVNINISSDVDEIRKWAQLICVSILEDNTDLANSIFKGLKWFDDKYCAEFIFKKGELYKNEINEYYITTGSGRSKGKYSIEFKPLNNKQ